jgi:hypothetical protein
MTGDARNRTLSVQDTKDIRDSGKRDSMDDFRIPSSLETSSNSDLELAEMIDQHAILSVV